MEKASTQLGEDPPAVLCAWPRQLADLSPNAEDWVRRSAATVPQPKTVEELKQK